eukprot:156618_1
MEPLLPLQEYQDIVTEIGIAYLMAFFSFCTTLLMIESKAFQIYFVFLWPLCVTIPIIILFNPLSSQNDTWFILVKITSVFLSSMFVFLILKYPTTKWWKICRYIFFMLNCIEVMVRDFQNKYYLNGCIAPLVIFGLPFWWTIFVEDKVVKWDSDWQWIALYTIWNLNFSYHNYTSLHYLNFVHPIIAVLLCIYVLDWKSYCLFRAWSLNNLFTVWGVFFPVFSNNTYIDEMKYNQWISMIYNVLTVVFAIIYVIYAIRNGRKRFQRKNISTQTNTNNNN